MKESQNKDRGESRKQLVDDLVERSVHGSRLEMSRVNGRVKPRAARGKTQQQRQEAKGKGSRGKNSKARKARKEKRRS